MDFPEDETDKFYIGSEDYSIYQCNLHSESQSHMGVKYESHRAPITKIHSHPGVSQSEHNGDAADFMLSASMDWTVKLWYPKIRMDPLLTFECA